MAIFAIPTCDRPNALARSLRSVVATVGIETHIETVLVLDDSRSAESAATNRRIADDYAGEVTIPIAYLGRGEKQQLAGELAKDDTVGVPPDVFDFALRGNAESAVGVGSGGSRNTALLLSAGVPLVSIDDDARFEFLSLNGTRRKRDEEVTIVSHREFAEEYVQGPVDSLRRIERLGRPVDLHVLDWIVSTLTMDHAASGENQRRVHAAMTGIAGNRWYERIEPPVIGRGSVRDTLLKNKRLYRKALSSGYAMMQAKRYVASDSPLFVTCCSGVDARRFLPPFPPDLRPDDTVFMWFLRHGYPRGLIGHLPVMVRHDLGPRRRDGFRDPNADAYNSGDIVAGIVSDIVSQTRLDSAESSVVNIGDRLHERAILSEIDFADYVHTVWTRSIGSTVANLEMFLRRYNEKPTFWADDVHRYIDTLRSHSPIVPVDAKEQLRRLQRYIGKLGQLLKWWPAIWDAAIERNRRIRDRTQGDAL